MSEQQEVDWLGRTLVDEWPEPVNWLNEADIRRDALDAWWDEVAELYATGLSTTELGRMFGRDASNIYRGLKQRGVAMRPAGWTGVRQTQRMQA